MKTNLERRQRKFTQKLLMPYRHIAAKTTDPDAKAAIYGLIRMVEHASSVMVDYDMAGPIDPRDEAFLDEAIEALDDDEKLAAVRQKWGK